MNIFDYIKELLIDFFNWFISLPFMKWILNTSFFIWLQGYKHICLSISGAIIENVVLSISAGACCLNWEMYFITCFVAIIASFAFDITMFLLFKFVFKQYVEKQNVSKNKIVKFINKFGVFSMFLYRFLPFCRIPAILLSLKSPIKKVITLNILGAIFAEFFFIGIGFLALS